MLTWIARLIAPHNEISSELRAELPTLAHAVRCAVAHVERDGMRVSVSHRMAELAELVRVMAKQSLSARVKALVRFSRAWDREIEVSADIDRDAELLKLGLGSTDCRVDSVRVTRKSVSVLSVEVLDTSQHDARTFVFKTITALGNFKMTVLLRGERSLPFIQLGFIFTTALGVAPALTNNRIVHRQYVERMRRGWIHQRICPISDEFAAAVMAIWLLDRPDELAQLKPLVSRRIYRMIVDYLPQVRELT